MFSWKMRKFFYLFMKTVNLILHKNWLVNAELQINRSIEDNSKIFFLFLNENICCDPSLEPSHRDGSNDGSQHKF